MVSHRRPSILARVLRPRRPATVVIPAPRRPGIERVDALTKLAHQVSPDELLAGRQRGDYQSFCGLRFMAASMVEPGCGHCQPCRKQATS